MSYLLLDDGFGEHQKVEPLSHVAFRAHVLALLYCARNLTDGYVSDRTIKVIGAQVSATPTKYRKELVASGLWREVPDGIVIHDYLEHNLSAEQVKAKKDAARRAARTRWGNAKGNAPRIPERNALHSTPSHSPESEASPPSLTSYEGGGDSFQQQDYNHALENLILLCDGSDDARKKLTEAMLRYPAPEARLARIHWACSQPSTRDRLAKAISMLKNPKEAAA